MIYVIYTSNTFVGLVDGHQIPTLTAVDGRLVAPFVLILFSNFVLPVSITTQPFVFISIR